MRTMNDENLGETVLYGEQDKCAVQRGHGGAMPAAGASSVWITAFALPHPIYELKSRCCSSLSFRIRTDHLGSSASRASSYAFAPPSRTSYSRDVPFSPNHSLITHILYPHNEIRRSFPYRNFSNHISTSVDMNTSAQHTRARSDATEGGVTTGIETQRTPYDPANRRYPGARRSTSR